MKKQLYTLSTAMLLAVSVFGQELYKVPEGTTSHMSSLENLNGLKGQGGKANHGGKGAAFTELKAGASQALMEVNTPGIIQRIWITISDQKPDMLRGLRLKIYWDGATVPAVDVPFGDFFCASVGRPTAFQSALFANPEGRSYNCYIPMPFKKGAKITLTNESGRDLGLLFFDVDFVQQSKPDKDALYFHSVWHEQKDSPIGQDLVLLPQVSGKGRFLGVSVGLNVNPAYGQSWWGEGEVKMYIDGDKTGPTINGTGAEDYIGTGWEEGVYADQYQGCLIADKAKKQYSFYRFHIPDAVYFQKDIRVTIQQLGGYFAPFVQDLFAKGVPLKMVSLGGAKGFRGLLDHPEAISGAEDRDWLNFYRSDDYAVTAYYYLNRP